MHSATDVSSSNHHDNQGNHGELMNCLMKERAQFATEDEFKVYALAEVRRFIVDLRTMDIELAVRNQTGRLIYASPKE